MDSVSTDRLSYCLVSAGSHPRRPEEPPNATRRDHRVAGADCGRRCAHRPSCRADLPVRQARTAGPGRQPHRQPEAAHDHPGQGVPRPYPDEPVGDRRLRTLVRRHRLPDAAADAAPGVRTALQGRLGAAGHRRLAAVRVLHRVHRPDDDGRHHRADRHPAAEPALPGLAASPGSRAPRPGRPTSSST